MRTLTAHRWELEYIWQTACHHLLKGKTGTPRGRGILPLDGQTPSRTGQVFAHGRARRCSGQQYLQQPRKGNSASVRPRWSGEIVTLAHKGKDRDREERTAATRPQGPLPDGEVLQKSLSPVPLENSLVARKPQHGVWSQGGIQPGEGAPGRPGVPATHCCPTEWRLVASALWQHTVPRCVVRSAGHVSELCWSKSSLGLFRHIQETRTNFWANPIAYVCVFPGGPNGKEPICQGRRCKRHQFNPWVGKIPWRRNWRPTPVFLLENSMDRGAWRATVHGVSKSQIQLSAHTHTHTHTHAHTS